MGQLLKDKQSIYEAFWKTQYKTWAKERCLYTLQWHVLHETLRCNVNQMQNYLSVIYDVYWWWSTQHSENDSYPCRKWKEVGSLSRKFICESRADWSITSDAVTWAGLNSGIQWRFFIKHKIPPGKGVSMSHGASQWRRIWKWRRCYQQNAFLETIFFPAIQFGNVVISELWLLYYYS